MTFPAPAVENPDAGFFYWPVVSVFALNTLLFLWCQTPQGKRDNSWIDCFWGLLFCVANLTVLILRATNSTKNESNICTECGMTMRMLFVSAPVFIWGLRLAIYICIRKKSEDYRYKEWRLGWEAKGSCNYYANAYFKVFFLQGFFSLINNSSVLYVNIYSREDASDELIYPTDIIGLCVWVAGFLIEVFADRQLAEHLANPKPGTGKFIKSGLWRYSRHPNYFGEAVMWWGLWIIALGVEWGWVTVYSCIFMTCCLRFLSTPLPENKYKNNPEW